jgi:hypothetical protein
MWGDFFILRVFMYFLITFMMLTLWDPFIATYDPPTRIVYFVGTSVMYRITWISTHWNEFNRVLPNRRPHFTSSILKCWERLGLDIYRYNRIIYFSYLNTLEFLTQHENCLLWVIEILMDLIVGQWWTDIVTEDRWDILQLPFALQLSLAG